MSSWLSTRRSSPCLVFGLLSLSLGQLGCGGQEAEQPRWMQVQQPIADGESDTTTTAVVAVLQPAFGRLCTGTLIAPNVVLTAGHCVGPTYNDQNGVLCDKTTLGPSSSASSFSVTTAASIGGGNLGDYFVQEVVRLPGDDELFCGNDAALLILKDLIADSEAQPIPPRVTEPLSGALGYSALGYGGTDNDGNGSGERRRRDALEVTCVGTACEDETVFANEWTGNGGICRGDSGGPAIDQDGQVAGIASRGDQDCTLSVYADTYSWADWLKDTVVYASGIGTYQAPDWTAGSSVNPEHSMPVGDPCSASSDCPSGRCIQDDNGDYCSRICDADAACPDDYSCEDYQGLDQCIYTPPVPPPPFKRAETDDCSVAQVGVRAPSSGWLLLLALPLWRLRRRRKRA